MEIFDANVIEENSIVTSAEPTLACLVRVCHEMSIPKFKHKMQIKGTFVALFLIEMSKTNFYEF